MARAALSVFAGAPLYGRRGAFYGIILQYRKNPQPFFEDLPKLFDLLARGKISPRIAGTPLLEAGGIEGKLVLAAPESNTALYA